MTHILYETMALAFVIGIFGAQTLRWIAGTLFAVWVIAGVAAGVRDARRRREYVRRLMEEGNVPND